jgi:hypothetical protein
MSETHLTWVYAVARDLDPAILESLDGVGGGPVRPVADAALTALTGPVAAGAFGEQALQRRLSEPGELEAIARAHHGVIAAVAAACPVLPLRLGTVYNDDNRVRELLAERRDEFAATLGQLADHVECGVKVCADLGALAGAAASEPPRPPTGAGGGRDRPGAGAAYLSRRRAQLAARDDRQLRAAERGAAIHAELSVLASAARRHPLQDQPPAATAGHEAAGQMVLNGAYLVPSAGAAQFATAARAIVADLVGFRLEVTGPWPPYSFADGTGKEDDQR